jgi:hypothetical protein
VNGSYLYDGRILSAIDVVSTIRITSTYRYVSRHLIKPKPNSARAGAFQVFVYGHFAGTVVSLGFTDFPVAPGDHSIQIRLRWFSSRKILVQLSPSESAVFSASVPKSLNSALDFSSYLAAH